MSANDPTGLTLPTSLAGSPLDALGSELARLANELFSGTPALSQHPGPSAFNVGGGGLAATAPEHPPTPGVLQSFPVASAPLPKESDLRTVPAAFSSLTGLPPLALVRTPDGSGASPYFLDIAGLGAAAPAAQSSAYPPSPSASAPPAPSGAPFASAPSVPSSAPFAPAALPFDATSTVLSENAAPGLPGDVPATGAPASTPGLETFEVRPDLVPKLGGSRGIFDAASIQKDFPILGERVHGRPLVWLDNAATTQKPRAVIDRLTYYYEHENSNVHRAAHTLSARATDAYEGARDKVRRFLNAPSAQEIVFARGATEAINLVAQSWGRRNLRAGDEIVITWLEHHANIVPWQQLCAEKGARLCVAPVDSTGQVILEEYEKLFSRRTRLAAVTQVSNALGTITPAREMVEIAHRHGALALVDGAQAVSHMPVDVQALDCDFYCFSGHKIYAPTGIGALYGKADVLADMPPWQGGGNMIRDVTFERTSYQAPPWRFEAGTGNIADAVGLGAALDYVTALGMENIARYEHELLGYATEQLLRVPGLRLIGTAAEKAGVLSFVLDGQRTEEIGGALDQEGIAVRSGHHCAQPILRRFGLESTVRASLAPYNTVDDIDALCAALARLQLGRSLKPA
jgi:cysteine desulfurase/selenocysteine lyase